MTPETSARHAVSAAQAFEMGHAWAMALRGQNLEDSRAVGRTLLNADLYPIHDAIRRRIDEVGFDSFASPDQGIFAARQIILAALEDGRSAPPSDQCEWLRPYRDFGIASGSAAADVLAERWIAERHDEAAALSRTGLRIDRTDPEALPCARTLARGSSLLAAAILLDDGTEGRILLRWRAGAEARSAPGPSDQTQSTSDDGPMGASLRACPHCGPMPAAPELVRSETSGRWQVFCGPCGSSSGSTKEPEQAAALWNSRFAEGSEAPSSSPALSQLAVFLANRLNDLSPNTARPSYGFPNAERQDLAYRLARDIVLLINRQIAAPTPDQRDAE